MIQLVGDGVAALTISTSLDPYLRPQWVQVLQDATATIAEDANIRAVVLTGTEKYFSAGAAEGDLVAAGAQDTIRRYVAEVPRALLSIPVPVIAAMAGHAIGGGLLIGLWADIPVLARQSLYGANFMALGFTPGMGSTRVLEHYFGPVLAQRMLYTGELMKGREIESAHVPMSHSVRDRDDVETTALDIATQMACAPREALVLLKQCQTKNRRIMLEAAIADETAMHAELFALPTTRERIQARYGATSV